MRKHVAFVIPRIGKGGAERVVANIANQMVSDGYPVSIYTILSGEENYKLAEGVNHVHLNVDDPNRLLRMIKRFIKLRSMVKRSDAETVVAFDRYYGILSALFTGKRVIGFGKYRQPEMHWFIISLISRISHCFGSSKAWFKASL